MNKMTLEEKLKVIKAFSEGKPVEIYTIHGWWEPKVQDVWDFNKCIYRVKPEASAKFKAGDIVVRECDEDWMMPDRRTIEKLKDGICYFADGSNMEIEDLERYYINEQDVLWYFEIYDYMSKKYIMNPTRATTAEMDKEHAGHHDTLRWEPIYALGFKLKEN